MIVMLMGRVSVQVDAARVDRSLTQAKNGPRRNPKADPVLLFWRHLVSHAVQDAKRTLHGLPTDRAILARWWISDHKPKQSDRDEWERCFECVCGWLDEDAAVYRKRLLDEVDASLKESYEDYVQRTVYVRKAMVLSCAGFPTAIARQFELALVAKKDYEDVAGIDYGDQFVMYDRRIEAA